MTPNPLFLYAVFHLNISFSSINEEQYPELIHRCYWPLLHLARKYNLPFGIEASGYTLETLAAHDQAWIDELHWLTSEGPCEFIGSGYAQIIGPLVPAQVNVKNLTLGHQVYERLLGFRPKIALVNEQVYSAGLIRNYMDAGYKAIIVDWENSFRYHPEWNFEWGYLPQIACSQQGDEIAAVWNRSIAFQKFQRYAHGELELDEYIGYLIRHFGNTPRAFPIYGNDCEAFDFRSGRYKTEDEINEEGEWNRLEKLFDTLLKDNCFKFISPDQVLELKNLPNAGNRLHLETPEQPMPVKKQSKYNPTRWAVTGRDDLGINTTCWRIYETMKELPTTNDADWRELCYLWGSDFRTHITNARWGKYWARLINFEKQRCADQKRNNDFVKSTKDIVEQFEPYPPGFKVQRDRRILYVETEKIKARINCRRGLAISGLWFKDISDQALLGTLHAGFYHDIDLSVDYYSGHLEFESPGQHKTTDLIPVEPMVTVEPNGKAVVVNAQIDASFGLMQKNIRFFVDDPKIEITYRMDWKNLPVGSMRLGYITLNPSAFDRSTLFYRTHNGGFESEKYLLAGKIVDHGNVVSLQISAEQCLGITEGIVEIGDADKTIRIEIDKAEAALIGMITYQEVNNTFLLRIGFSASEVDETRLSAVQAKDDFFARMVIECK